MEIKLLNLYLKIKMNINVETFGIKVKLYETLLVFNFVKIIRIIRLWNV